MPVWPSASMQRSCQPVRVPSISVVRSGAPASSCRDVARKSSELIFRMPLSIPPTRIRQSGEIPLLLKREGQLGDAVTNQLPDGVNPERVAFLQGDAENLPDSIGRFDAITFANVLDRLPHPRRALDKLADITNPGAQLVVCSPFTWWDEFTTPKSAWGASCATARKSPHMTRLSPHSSRTSACRRPVICRF